MSKKQPKQNESVARVEVACEECGHVGPAGSVVVPYVFELKAKRRWLCSIGTPRKCLEIAWQRFRPSGASAVESGSSPSESSSDVVAHGAQSSS